MLVQCHIFRISDELQHMSGPVEQNLIKTQEDQEYWHDKNARQRGRPGVSTSSDLY